MTTEQKIFLGQCFNNATHIVAAQLSPGGLSEVGNDDYLARRIKQLTIALGAEMKDLFFPPQASTGSPAIDAQSPLPPSTT